MAASFQEAVVDVLVGKTRQALRRTGLRRLGVGGGVVANAPFCASGWPRWPIARGSSCSCRRLSLCTDNAAMAGVAFEKLAAGQVAELTVDVTAGLVRPGR